MSHVKKFSLKCLLHEWWKICKIREIKDPQKILHNIILVVIKINFVLQFYCTISVLVGVMTVIKNLGMIKEAAISTCVSCIAKCGLIMLWSCIIKM